MAPARFRSVIDAVNGRGLSPLGYAVKRGHLRVVAHLVSTCGASVNVPCCRYVSNSGVPGLFISVSSVVAWHVLPPCASGAFYPDTFCLSVCGCVSAPSARAMCYRLCITCTFDRDLNLGGDGNALSGTIPPSICGMSALEKLNVGTNKLSGGLPDCITALTGLKYVPGRVV